MTAWCFLLNIYLEWQWSSECLVSILQILTFIDGKKGQRKQRLIPKIVSEGIFQLVSQHGLDGVRDAYYTALGEEVHETVHFLLNLAVRSLESFVCTTA